MSQMTYKRRNKVIDRIIRRIHYLSPTCLSSVIRSLYSDMQFLTDAELYEIRQIIIAHQTEKINLWTDSDSAETLQSIIDFLNSLR